VVSLTPEIQGVTPWLLIGEIACGVAKQLGRGRVHVARANDPEVARRQSEREWLHKTQQAVDHNRFRLMFQRIVPLQKADDGRLHCELLLRMLDASEALVSPDVFMPVAERYHLSAAVDRWVIQNAFEWLAADVERARRLAMCSINLSAGSLCDPDFIAFLLATREARHVPAGLVCLEITETAAMADIGTAADVIRDLRAVGFQFALDDFGSGLCSFTYLKQLPVDYVKIDGSFIKHIDTDPTSRAMVQSINWIGQATGKRTIAEFVENDAIRKVVTQLGVDYAQGHGIHRPSPIESL
jgi:EAL domain-containing protein (putative c-di-GMP-specific phosphodiesterase class I)